MFGMDIPFLLADHIIEKWFKPKTCRVGLFAIRFASGRRIPYKYIDWYKIAWERPEQNMYRLCVVTHSDQAYYATATYRQYRRFDRFAF